MQEDVIIYRKYRYRGKLIIFLEAQLKAADINKDEKITTTDLVKLRKYLAGLGE